MDYMKDLVNKVAEMVEKKFVDSEGNVDSNFIKEAIIQNDIEKKLDENRVQELTDKIYAMVQRSKKEVERKIDLEQAKNKNSDGRNRKAVGGSRFFPIFMGIGKSLGQGISKLYLEIRGE